MASFKRVLVEITATTIADWAKIPEYASALERILGQSGAQTSMVRAQQEMPAFNRYARQIYRNGE